MNKKIKIALRIACGLVVSYFFFRFYLNHFYYVEKKIGDIQICNIDLQITLYKTLEFDHSIPIHYQLYKGDSLIQDHQFLTGISDFDITINSFIPNCEDSIFTLATFDEKDTVLTLNINDFTYCPH